MSDSYGPPAGQDPRGALTQRTWALVAQIGTLVAAYVALGFLAPLIVLLVKGDDSPFVRRHAVESLNFQISLLIYSLVGGVLGFLFAVLTVGLGLIVLVPLVIVLAIVVLALIIIATVRASNGEDYRYPLTIRFIS